MKANYKVTLTVKQKRANIDFTFEVFENNDISALNVALSKLENIKSDNVVEYNVEEIDEKNERDETFFDWIDAILKNDEASSNEELLQHFIKEGKMSVVEAKHYVAQRQDCLINMYYDLIRYEADEDIHP